jgi:hypothetical protein
MDREHFFHTICGSFQSLLGNNKEGMECDMSETKKEKLKDFEYANLRDLTNGDLETLKHLSDDDLLRATATLDMFASVESMRRLRKALHREEKAIKWLTVVLVLLTIILVYLGFKVLIH